MIHKEQYLNDLVVFFQMRGITKLEKPEDTKECVHCSCLIGSEADFDVICWRPMLHSFANAVLEADNGEYYSLNIDIHEGVFYVTSSRGAI